MLVSPGEISTIDPTSRGKLPLCLRGKCFPCPSGVGLRIFVCDVHNWMIFDAVDRALRTKRMTPAGTGHPRPPIRVVAGVNLTARLVKYRGTGYQGLRKC